MTTDMQVPAGGKSVWVETEVRCLDVEETKFLTRRGTDGQQFFVDCTRS